MVCVKCGYKDLRKKIILGEEFCSVCSKFVPIEKDKFEKYKQEKIDWKILDTFRNSSIENSVRKEGMSNAASKGLIVTRAPLGYSVINGKLVPNEDSSKVYSLFHTFLTNNVSLNCLSKNFGVSVNGIKKILTNRVYLGEIKFDKKLYKSNHQPIVTQEIFYAVQRKLSDYLNQKNHL